MPYGNITGYTPVEGTPDAYTFQTKDGGSALFFGQEAAALKEKVDAADAARPLLAANDAGMSEAPPVAADVGPNMSPNPGPQASPPPADVPVGGMSVPPEANQSVQPVANMSPNPGPAPAPAPPPGPAPVMMNGVNTGMIQNPNGTISAPVAATAGSPGGPVQKTETRAGGFKPSEEYLERQEDLRWKRQAGLEVATEAATQEAAERQAFLREEQKQNAIQAAEGQKRQAAIDERVNGLMAKYQQAEDDYAGSKIKTDDRSFGERMFDGLMVGLGTLGSGMAHQPNVALSLYNTKVENRLKAQEAEIAIKKDHAKNTLADLQRTLGSQELAREAFKGIMAKQASNQLQLIAAKSSDAKIRANALETAAKIDAEYADTIEGYRQKALGNVTKSFVIAPKVAASAGGYRQLSPAESVKFATTAASTEGTVAGTAKTLDSLNKGGPKTESDKKVHAALRTADVALKSLGKYKDDDVADLPENQGAVRRAWNATEDFFMGAGNSARTDLTKEERALIQDTEAARGYVKSLTSVLSGQGALSGPESEAADRGLAPGATVGEIKRAVSILRGRAQSIVDEGGTIDVPEPPSETPSE